MIYVHPQAEPFILRGNTDTALLFIHGFTASPSEIYPVARLIHETNSCTVCGILLPGHGSSPQFLNRCHWTDWYRAVEKELCYLLDNYKQVFVGGLSMGGLLALHAGLHYNSIKGVISINAPIYYKQPFLTSCAHIFGWIRPYYPKKIDKQMLELERQGRFAYRVMPAKAFNNLTRLRREVMKEIDQLNIPLLLIQSLQDETVDARSGKFLFEKTQAVGASLIELKESRHIASMGPEKERIAQDIAAFMGMH